MRSSSTTIANLSRPALGITTLADGREDLVEHVAELLTSMTGAEALLRSTEGEHHGLRTPGEPFAQFEM